VHKKQSNILEALDDIFTEDRCVPELHKAAHKNKYKLKRLRNIKLDNLDIFR